MKKITILVLTCICLVSVSCRHPRNTQVSETRVDYVEKFEYNGHHYLMFKTNGSTNYHNMSGVVHDPDCPCHNK